MRPQDIVVLLKLVALGEARPYIKDLAASIHLSQSETSQSLARSIYAGLLAEDQRTVMRGALFDFLRYGLRYVFPQRPGALVTGMPTAYAAPPLASELAYGLPLVWPWAQGAVQGQSLAPLYPTVPAACAEDPALHSLLALCDALRTGQRREVNLAQQYLEAYLLQHEPMTG
ncbi:MAG: hypothetical protein D6722_15125 [Bacteroidetes bacterium]|nr:MAG: hypothetical protein D6722_15125 [Bacteroidota bacterium]